MGGFIVGTQKHCSPGQRCFCSKYSGCPRMPAAGMQHSRDMEKGLSVMAVQGLGPPLVPVWDQSCPQGTCLPAKLVLIREMETAN